MQWSDIQFHPPGKTLRQFAGLCLVFFSGLAVWHATTSGRGTLTIVLAALALITGLVGLLCPWLIRPIYVGWMVLAFPIGWTVSQAMLALMFYGLFTPIGLLFRLTGRDLLQRGRRPRAESYWSPKPSTTDPRRYFKQF
jgi:Saxitoxin biosynthesis operon protein SxtJ